jgi:hypothetical protein
MREKMKLPVENREDFYSLWCLLPGHKRRQAVKIHSNIGANVYWCPKHGMLLSMTLGVDVKNHRQIGDKQWDLFEKMRGK